MRTPKFKPPLELARLIKVAQKELKQQLEAGVQPTNPQRCRNQSIANYAAGFVSLGSVKQHFLSLSGDYGLTGEEAGFLKESK